MNKEEWNEHCKAVIDTMTSAKQFIKDEIQYREGGPERYNELSYR